MIQAKVVADSKNEFGNRITTMVITFPRIILAEFNTHRMFSRNSALSRAISFEKMLKSVQENPFIPVAWMKDHRGMQGTEYFDARDTLHLRTWWLEARDYALTKTKSMAYSLNPTKQILNRLLEPFMYHTVIVTATEWENFFALRCPAYSLFSENMPMEFRSKKDLLRYVKHVEADKFKNDYDNLTDLDWLACNKGQAEIHMMALAECMWDAYNESTPKQLKAGEWHIPFEKEINEIERDTLNPNPEEYWTGFKVEVKVKISTACCARVSYTVVGEEDKKSDYEADIKLHDRLAASGHWSPFEHCAQAKSSYLNDYNEEVIDQSGNFLGFTQYRKTFNNENITK